MHWDLASDPVSHEQRQGRIQRYAGLGIRGAIARYLGAAALVATATSSEPWVQLATVADAQLADASGLKPWWILPGAETEKILFAVATGEQEARFKWLQEQVLLYRPHWGTQIKKICWSCSDATATLPLTRFGGPRLNCRPISVLRSPTQ